MPKSLILFAASRDQKRYFDQVEQNVVLSGQKIISVKSSGVPFAFKALWRCFFQLPNDVVRSLKEQVTILKNRKQVSRKGCKQPQFYWWLFTNAEYVRAKYLFIRYSLWLEKNHDVCIGVWNGKKFRQAILILAANQYPIPLIFFETGPLPGYSVADPEGVDFYAAIPRSVEFYKEYQCHLGSSMRLDFESVEKPKDLPESYIFIPFQVVEDSNIYLHSPWIKDMRAFYVEIEMLAKQFPLQQFIIKPHPACPEDYSDLVAKEHPQIHFITDRQTTALVQHAEAVITVNSTVGMEALIAHKKVVVLGQAIYGFDGLTKPVNNRLELLEAIKSLESWVLDDDLIDNYLCYLQADYALPGDAMQNPTVEHWKALSGKLQMYLAGHAYKAIGL